MENFTISSRITTKEYIKVMFVGLYKKPIFILATFIGLYYILTFVLDHFEFLNFYTGTPYFEIFFGLFLLLSPSLITGIAIRQFVSNPSFRNEIKYTFGENEYVVEGITFKAEFLWSHIIKQKEISKFLILYHNKKAGNFIDKTKLTLDQIQFIKSKIGQK
jgi:hypothetical protein